MCTESDPTEKPATRRDPGISSRECIFTGESPENEEHVIPRWMQSRFKLWNQTVYIPNGTRLKYKFVKVPVRAAENTKFGDIESRISRGIFDPQEVYLWALKIHVGFIFRDATLRIDRADPRAGTILDVDDFSTEIQIFRMLFRIWSAGGNIRPNPFGSVFIFDALDRAVEFDFIHCNVSGTVALQLGTKFVYVSLWDQSDGMSSNVKEMWENHHKIMVERAAKKDRLVTAMVAQRVWSCETSYWLYRNRRSFSFVKTKNSFALIPPTMRLPWRSSSQDELAQFCRSYGLRLRAYNGEAGNIFESVHDPLEP